MAGGDLVGEGAVHAVAVEVHEAIAFGGPEEVSIRFKVEVVGDVDPGGVVLGEHGLWGLVGGGGVAEVEAEILLAAVEGLDGDALCVREPLDAEEPLEGSVGEGDPVGGGIRERDDTDANDGIMLSGFWVGLMDEAGIDGREADEGADGDAGLIGLEVGDGGGVRSPPGGDVLAAEDLLPIDPGEGSVEGGGGAVVGELFFLLCGEVEDVEIVVADEGDEVAVG